MDIMSICAWLNKSLFTLLINSCWCNFSTVNCCEIIPREKISRRLSKLPHRVIFLWSRYFQDRVILRIFWFDDVYFDIEKYERRRVKLTFYRWKIVFLVRKWKYWITYCVILVTSSNYHFRISVKWQFCMKLTHGTHTHQRIEYCIFNAHDTSILFLLIKLDFENSRCDENHSSE